MRIRMQYMPNVGLGIWFRERHGDDIMCAEPIYLTMKKVEPGTQSDPALILPFDEEVLQDFRHEIELLMNQRISVRKELLMVHEAIGELRRLIRKAFSLEITELEEGARSEFFFGVRKFMRLLNQQEREFDDAVKDGAEEICLPPSVEQTGTFELYCQCERRQLVVLNFVHTVHSCENCERVYALKIDQPKEKKEDDDDS